MYPWVRISMTIRLSQSWLWDSTQHFQSRRSLERLRRLFLPESHNWRPFQGAHRPLPGRPRPLGLRLRLGLGLGLCLMGGRGRPRHPRIRPQRRPIPVPQTTSVVCKGFRICSCVSPGHGIPKGVGVRLIHFGRGSLRTAPRFRRRASSWRLSVFVARRSVRWRT